ncbi:MAG: TfoX/Sxy family protein [Pseudomonadota bacterium]
MAKKYLQPLSNIIQEAVARRSDEVQPICKHFFSGATVSVNRNTCISFSPAGFAIKLGKKDRDKLLAHHDARPLRYFENSPVKREYVVLPDPWLDDKETLHHWINASIDFVISE